MHSIVTDAGRHHSNDSSSATFWIRHALAPLVAEDGADGPSNPARDVDDSDGNDDLGSAGWHDDDLPDPYDFAFPLSQRPRSRSPRGHHNPDDEVEVRCDADTPTVEFGVGIEMGPPTSAAACADGDTAAGGSFPPRPRVQNDAYVDDDYGNSSDISCDGPIVHAVPSWCGIDWDSLQAAFTKLYGTQMEVRRLPHTEMFRLRAADQCQSYPMLGLLQRRKIP